MKYVNKPVPKTDAMSLVTENRSIPMILHLLTV